MTMNTIPVCLRLRLGAAGLLVLAPANPTVLGAQESKGVHVCLGADNLLRFTATTRCPPGQRKFRLAEVEEEDLSAAKEADEPSSAVVADLKAKIDFLTRRVQNIETEALKAGKNDPQLPTQVKAPFEVVDKAGNPIFVVADVPHGSVVRKGRMQIARAVGDGYSMAVSNAGGKTVVGFGDGGDAMNGGQLYVADEAGRMRLHAADGLKLFSTTGGRGVPLEVFGGQGERTLVVTDRQYEAGAAGRVHIGRGSGANYGVYVLRAGGQFSVGMGEGNDGNGVLVVNDAAGKTRAELYGARGFALNGVDGKEVASLTLDPRGNVSAVLGITGLMQIFDMGGQTVVEAGSANGRGIVRTGPKFRCAPSSAPLVAGVPDCIMGIP